MNARRFARRQTHWSASIPVSVFLSVVLLLLLAPKAFCQQDFQPLPQRYWVMLQQNADIIAQDSLYQSRIELLRSQWPERSLQRRIKNGCGVSSSDIPIAPEQIEALSETGVKIICRSRWLRAVSVEADKAQLDKIRELPFIAVVIPVLSLKRQTTSCDRVWTPCRKSAHLRQGVHTLSQYGRSVAEEESFDEITVADLPVSEATPLGSYGFSFRQAELARAIEIHRRGGTGQGVLIGMLDTGFQLDHRAFAGLELIAQFDFINHDPDPSYDPRTDAIGQANHGTACLSVIGGVDPARLIGIAPRASFALGKTEDTRSETAVEEDYWIEAIEWLEWLGADVVSSSLTYRAWYRSDEMDGRAPISRAAQRAAELGMVICVSAGNAGPGEITIGAPADAAGVLAVAAVDSSGRLTNFSSRGPASDGRIKPDIAAMGRQVVCVKPMSYDRYARWNGTSLACPIAAGVAALVIEAHPDWPGEKVVEALRMTASQSYMPDDAYGYGLIDAVEAVDYPSLTVFIERFHEPSVYQLQLWNGKQSVYHESLQGNYARITNLPSGVYRLELTQHGALMGFDKSKNYNRSIVIPPSEVIFLENP